MAPIKIDGTDITGATIDGTDVQEITVDGQTVFTVGPPEPPASAVHRYFLDDVNGTVVDSIGNDDGNVLGVSSIGGNFVGGSAGNGDGVDDSIQLGTLGSYGSSLTGGFGFMFTIQTNDNDSAIAGGLNRDASNTFVFINILSDGTLELRIREDSGANIHEVRSTTSVDDNNLHRIVITGNNIIDPNTTEIYVDGVEEGFVNLNEGVDNYSDFEGFALFARFRPDIGSPPADDNFDGILDDFIMTDGKVTTQEVADDFSRQPWSP